MKSIKLMLLGVLIMQGGTCLLIIFSLKTVPAGFEWPFYIVLAGLIVGIVGYRRKDAPVPPQTPSAPPAQPATQTPAAQPARTERSSS